MNKSLSTLVLMIVLVASSPSYAATIEGILQWNDANGPTVVYKKDGEDESRRFTAEIGHSKAGEQRIYFASHYSNTMQNTTKNIEKTAMEKQLESIRNSSISNKPFNVTMVFDGQAVKMTGFRKKYTDTQNPYSSYTPETDKGHAYIIDLFKKSTSPIKVEFNNDTLYFPVTGFTKKWNSGGGNAI